MDTIRGPSVLRWKRKLRGKSKAIFEKGGEGLASGALRPPGVLS